MISASALPRILRCPGSEALPQARTVSEWADAGTDRHAEVEDGLLRGDLTVLPERVRRMMLDHLPPSAALRPEVSVAYDVATGDARELDSVGRAYGTLSAFEIPGCIDLLVTAPGFVMVCDWKGYEEVEEPARNEQTTLYALAAARILRAHRVIVLIGHLPTDRCAVAELDTIDLDSFAMRLREVHPRVAAQKSKRPIEVDVSEGTHCKYCPAAHICPAKVALIKRLVTGGEADELEMLIPLNEETAATAHERLAHAKNLLKRIERALYAFGKERPFRLGNGNVFGPYTKVGNEKLDGDRVWDVVKEMYGRDCADAAVGRVATKTKLGEALKHHGVSSVEKAKDVILAEVRKRGGSRRDEKPDVGEHEPELPAKAG